jgi:2-polyprenyl-3-methyl-5-hydroxy-6-metoxy-1,4-benzoquinol methylase
LDPDYGRHYRELYEKHWWWRAREVILLEELHRLFPDSRALSILDVGCGDGLFFEQLRQFGEVEGIESEAALVDPRGPNRSRIAVAPFDGSFNPGKKFDLVLMLDVLEHLDAPEEALRHAVSLLRAGGMIVVTVPAFRLLWTNHDRLNEHRTRFTKRSFCLVAAAAGMEIMEMRYFFNWLFAAKLAARMAESILPREPRIPRIPSSAINGFLYQASRAEEILTRRLRVPFGGSLLAIGRRTSEEKSLKCAAAR